MSKFETLAEISDLSLGRDFRGKVPVEPNGDILVIQPKDVFSESIEEAVSVREHSVGAIHDRLLHPGDILCSIRHRFVSMVVKEEWLKHGPVIANSGLFIIRLNQKDYLPEYVSAFINCFFERKEFQDMLERQKQEKSGLNSFHKNSIWQKTGKSTPSRKNEDQSQNRQKHSKPICGTHSKNCGKSRLNKLLTHNLSPIFLYFHRYNG